MRDRIKHEATIDLIIHPEDLPIRGNLVFSGDGVLDTQLENAVIEELEHNPWAWCMVEVKATWKGLSHSQYLGCCSYRSEGNFRVDGYYNDMVTEAIEQLHQQAKDIIDAWS